MAINKTHHFEGVVFTLAFVFLMLHITICDSEQILNLKWIIIADVSVQCSLNIHIKSHIEHIVLRGAPQWVVPLNGSLKLFTPESALCYSKCPSTPVSYRWHKLLEYSQKNARLLSFVRVWYVL